MNVYIYMFMYWLIKLGGGGVGIFKYVFNFVVYILFFEYFLKNKVFDYYFVMWYFGRFNYYENDYLEKWF